jgi:hypothetical protein
MKLAALKDPEKWRRRIAITKKRIAHVFRSECDSKPIFVLGKQRSGTSMLMHAFHRHGDMLVFDEHQCNDAFRDFRLRDLPTIQTILDRARFPAVCFKPISDSHNIVEIHSQFTECEIIWLYRNFKDVANSSLRKFDDPLRAIRLVSTNQIGGGWFQDGISPDVAKTLQMIYRPSFSNFDLACLTWWARNQIIIESGLVDKPNVTIMRYEALAKYPDQSLRWLFDRLKVEYKGSVATGISARSIRRHAAPPLNSDVERLCVETLTILDNAFWAQSPTIDKVESSSQRLE